MIKIVITLLLISTIGNTQSGGNFSMEKAAIASGGGQSQGGNFSLTASIGQTDASDALTGGNYALNGGFWVAKQAIVLPENIFTNGFEN